MHLHGAYTTYRTIIYEHSLISLIRMRETRILLLSWFDSNVCTILRHLSLIAWFICELIHFIMSWTFLKGLLS